jgi:hypothetical protein
MLRNGLIALLSIVIALGLFVFSENKIAPHFQSCIGQTTADQGNTHTEKKGPIVVSVIRAQIICSIALIDRHNGFFAALAGVAVAAFTFTLWVATDQLAKSGQRAFEATERAFVFLDGFNYELTTRADLPTPANMKRIGIHGAKGEPEWYRSFPQFVITSFAMQPRWKNSGSTPTRNMTIQVDWRGPPGPVPPAEYVYRGSPQPFFLPPGAVETSGVIEVTSAAADIVKWSMSPLGVEPFILIWGRADYEDVFQKKHFVEWCHRLRLSRPVRDERMGASTFQWGDYNRSDEN